MLLLLTTSLAGECILAQRHFCSLKNALYHARNSDLCLSSLFLRNDKLIERNSKLSITNFTKHKLSILTKAIGLYLSKILPDENFVQLTYSYDNN